ncbi:restriction endonuclease subunit S [Roseateles sp. 22389]|uniref:restriction endonuclease subunit S n=1 Tax=Roseateles sp. 22389 TaxID=3453916 RepID=UPI003F870A6F
MSGNWQLLKLRDVCELVNGRAYSKDELLSSGKYPVLRVGNFFTNKNWYYSDLELQSEKYCDNGDLLYAWSASFGPRIWEGERAIFHYHIWKVIPVSSVVVQKYLYYFFMWDTERIKLDQGAGATMIHVAKGSMEDRSIPVPPLADQERIVAILDEAFDGIAYAKANVERSLLNTRELVNNVMHATFVGHGTDWTEKTLGDVCDIASKLIDPRDNDYLDLPHIGAGNIESKSGALVDIKTAREEQLISGKFLFDESAVLYSKIRPYLMKVVRPAFSGLCSADIYPLVPKPGGIDRDYLYYLLLSPSFTEYAIKGSARAGMPKVNRDHLFAYRSRMPPVQDQAKVAAKLDALVEGTQRLVEVCEAKQAALGELKESLLHQAFSGQLTSAKAASASAAQTLPTTSPEFSANVIALAYERHKRQRRERTFGHVKEQKLLHLVEAVGKVDLGRQPMRDAAGPNDFRHMLKAEEWAKQNGFFEMIQREGGYDFKKLPAFDQLLAKAPQVLGAYLDRIESVIDLLVPMDTVDAEVLATVHAAWNNLLIDGAEVTDAALVWEAREGWHAGKLAIPESKFRQAIAMIRSKGLVPDGTGKYVGGQTALI